MPKAENQSGNGLKNHIRNVIFLDHKQKNQHYKQQRTDRKPRIHFIVIHYIIRKRQSGKRRDQQSIDTRRIELGRFCTQRQV